jgi:hypothetical protein
MRKTKGETVDIKIDFPAPPQSMEKGCEEGFAQLAPQADGAVGSYMLRDGATWTGVVQFDESADAVKFLVQVQTLTGNLNPVVLDVKDTVN